MLDGAVFLDCGSHNGSTLDEVLKPRYGFKSIYGFEPMPNQFAHLLKTYHDDRLTLCNYGLSDQSATMEMYGSNDIAEASLFAEKRDVNQSIVTPCQIVEASEFFREHISADDCNLLKLNCEGAEVLILNNLIDSGEIWKLSNVVITWDCRCIAGEEHHEPALINRMNAIGFDRWISSDDAYVDHTGPHERKIQYWLDSIA